MITKAIIPVAGWGTRLLPITKAIEKSMLPVGNKPLVDYIVQDCIKAGITDIYFVIAEGSTQLKQYYSDNDQLNQYLIQNGKNDLLKTIALPVGVTFHYIEQPRTGKYGTAVPVALAADYIVDNESVAILMGDDFVYNLDGSSEVKRLIDSIGDADGAVLGKKVSTEDLDKYGVIETSESNEFIRIVEKPAPEDAPSGLTNIGKYVLNHDAIKQISVFVSSNQVGEYYITDAINNYVSGGGRLKVIEASGEHLDGGNLEGWLHANRVVLGDLA